MTYRVHVWREPQGGWSASAVDVDGAFTAGDSLAEIDRNIRESIAVSLDLPRGAEVAMTLELNISVDGEVDALVGEAREARQSAQRAVKLTQQAVWSLRAKGLSVRDVARTLAITPGRVTQLEHAHRTPQTA